MSFEATVIKVMIASPSDVPAERAAIREIIAEWNHVHAEERRQVLLPVGWETHSTPTMGDRPQAIINKQVLANCDLLVAVFWTRLGSATGAAKSGTVEEIEEHLKAGKPAMLYFSNCPVHPGSIDEKQYRALTKFKEECFRRGIVHSYETPEQFRDEFRRHLAQKIIQEFPQREAVIDTGEKADPPLSPLAIEILLSAVKSNSRVHIARGDGSMAVLAGKQFDAKFSMEKSAELEDAVSQLVRTGMLQPPNRGLHNVSPAGFQFARQQSTQDPPLLVDILSDDAKELLIAACECDEG